MSYAVSYIIAMNQGFINYRNNNMDDCCQFKLFACLESLHKHSLACVMLCLILSHGHIFIPYATDKLGKTWDEATLPVTLHCYKLLFRIIA